MAHNWNLYYMRNRIESGIMSTGRRRTFRLVAWFVIVQGALGVIVGVGLFLSGWLSTLPPEDDGPAMIGLVGGMTATAGVAVLLAGLLLRWLSRPTVPELAGDTTSA